MMLRIKPKLENYMTKKMSANVQHGERSLREMLLKFFAQNTGPKIIKEAEHTSASLQQDDVIFEQSSEDSREKYWREREARPSIANIGSCLEWDLLMSLVNHAPYWRHDGWWCDGVHFFDVTMYTPNANTLRGTALTDWMTSDKTVDVNSDLDGFALAEIELRLVGEEKQLQYSISLWMDNHYHWFSENDFVTLPLTSTQIPQPDIQNIVRIFEETIYREDDWSLFIIPKLVEKFAPELISQNPKLEVPIQAKLEEAAPYLTEEDVIVRSLNLPEIIEKLSALEKRIAWSAAEYLGTLGIKAKVAVPNLLAIIYDDQAEEHLRYISLLALIQIGLDDDDAVSLFKYLIRLQDGELFLNARTALTLEWRFYSNAIPVISLAKPEAAIPAILKMLKDPKLAKEIDFSVSSDAFKYLQNQGALPAILELLETDEWFWNSSNSLSKCGDKAVPKLLELLTDSEISTRVDAAEALGKIKNSDPLTLNALRNSLYDSDLSVCVRSAEALGNIGVPALAILIEALEIEDKLILCWVMKSLGEVGATAKSALEKLNSLLESTDSTISYFASKAATQILQ